MRDLPRNDLSADGEIMSRVLPVSHLKGRRKVVGRPLSAEPRVGTAIRAIYDQFMSNKGSIIPYSKKSNSRQIQDLTDYYGLDIRRVGYGRYCLVGEWFGKVYIDYLAERINQTSDGARP